MALSVPTKRLAQPILSTDMSFQLNNILSWGGMVDGVTKLQTSDFGAVGYGVFRNTANTQIEFFTFDPTTIQNSSITILARGCSYAGGVIDGAASKYSWAANTTLVELGTSAPAMILDTSSNQQIGGKKTFTTIPASTDTPISGTDMATKAYVDATATGHATYDQQVIAAVAGETLTLGQHVYLKESDQRWYRTDASIATTYTQVKKGFVEKAGTAGGNITVQIAGPETNQSGLTPGSKYYISDTPGSVTSTAGGTGTDQSQILQDGTLIVGQANSTGKKYKAAQSFIPAKGNISFVKLYKIADTGTFTGTVTISIQADSAGSPSGSDLVAVTLSNAEWKALTAAQLNQINFATPYTPTIGNTYWIVITSNTADDSNHPNFGYKTSDVYASGLLKTWNVTDAWSAAGGDLTFQTGYNITETMVGVATAAGTLQIGYNEKYLPTSAEKSIISIFTNLTGVILPYAGAAAPTGWLLCDGSAVSRTTYATLYAVIGTTYGIGDGTTTFNLPNMAGRSVIGVDSTAKAVLFDCATAFNEQVIGNVTASADSQDFKEGAASAKIAVGASFTTGIIASKAISSASLAGYTSVSFWLKSDVAMTSGQLQFLLDDTANCASPLETINIPAIVANVWTKVILTLANPQTDSAIISIGLKLTADLGAQNIWIDDINKGDIFELGQTGGEKRHLLTTEEIPAHSHGIPQLAGGSGVTSVSSTSAGGASGSNIYNTFNTGGGLTHNNLQPYLALNHIIKT